MPFIRRIFLFIITILCTLNYSAFVFATFVTVCVCFSEWYKINAKYFKKKAHFYNWYLIINALALVYLLIFFASALELRGQSFQGGIYFIIILCICICSDIGGYIFGKAIGGKKLIKISPNKTISGSVGSFLVSLLPIVLFNFQNYMDFNSGAITKLSDGNFAILGQRNWTVHEEPHVMIMDMDYNIISEHAIDIYYTDLDNSTYYDYYHLYLFIVFSRFL